MKRSLSADPRPTSSAEQAGDDAAPQASDDELREARALAEALARGEDPLAVALRSAARSGELDEADHEALLARVLGGGEEEAPPTKAEQRSADRLREALEGEDERRSPPALDGSARRPQDELVELAGSLRAAWRPRPLLELQSRRLIERALRAPAEQRHRRLTPVTMAALSTLAAIAAGAALLFGEVGELAPASSAPVSSAAAPARRAALIPARTTAALFDAATPFPREGGQTERIDRIASSRASDLRANRYSSWGVR